MSRAVAEVDLTAIAHNLKLIKSKTDTQVLAVVKADAYGHGLIPVAKAVVAAGADWLGTALLEEGIALRAAGVKAPLICWLTPLGEDLKIAVKNNIDLSISSIELLEEVIDAGRDANIVPRIHLEVDTGMTRGGVRGEWPEFVSEVARAVKDNGVEVVGLWSHFARADEPDQSFNQQQLDTFHKRLATLIAQGINPQFVHIANSAAALTNNEAVKNIVRWGIGLYGLSPDVNTLGDSAKLNLKPAMKLKAKLHLVKKAEAGAPVGYGGTATVAEDTKIGVVTMGYADGIPRNASNLAGVFVDGHRAPLLGRVSMDQFVVNLGANSNAKTGDEVVIFGDGALGEYTVDDWASAAGTINYEIVTRIGPRVPRIYPRG
jgi:alanine racemase